MSLISYTLIEEVIDIDEFFFHFSCLVTNSSFASAILKTAICQEKMF